MEGLLLAQALVPLQRMLRSEPASNRGWRFPDSQTLVLNVGTTAQMWIDLRPPNPKLKVLASALEVEATPRTPFQALLASRATGVLACATQAALDRRFTLEFSVASGFVPVPAVRLEVELTGRHANALLTDLDGRILAVHREVRSHENRYRELRPGIPYVPPPPYRKLDPRTASDTELIRALAGQPLRDVGRILDGFGPNLSAALVRLSGLPAQECASVEGAPTLLAALRELLADPLAAAQDAGLHPTEERQGRWREAAVRSARATLDALLLRAERQLSDAEQAITRAESAATVRGEADILMAYAGRVSRGSRTVLLPGFEGEPVQLDLDPKLSPIQNAERRYQVARRSEERARRASERLPELQAQLRAARAQRESLEDLSDEALRVLVGEPRTVRRRVAEVRPGLWLRAPHGFEVVLGRNARENDAVTFKVGRSRDLWLHAQGVHGAHVIVRSGGREVPVETLRFAAELAAGYAEGFNDGTVLVDVTERKHVWKVKGMPAGAVHYAHQRTLAVTPKRVSEVVRTDPDLR